MKIYKAEQDAGLEKVITSSAVAYCLSDVEKVDIESLSERTANCLKSTAGIRDQDLYITKSILVSSTWNKNDDVFDPKEIWRARMTPDEKPTNLNHDECEIVGHIVGTYAMTADGVNIPFETPEEEVPDLFHLVNEEVIYLEWESESLMDRTIALLTDIADGKKCVSMECRFNDFDYAVQNEDGKTWATITRSEDTCDRSRYLRSYGGTGIYEGKPIGRLLKNITFSAKGYVDNPANPDSQIISSGGNSSTLLSNSKSCVSSDRGLTALCTMETLTIS